MRKELQRKVDFAIKLLQSIPQDCEGGVEVSYSGGKDSDVILELAKMSGIKYEAIYKNTTIDFPGTIKHAKEMGATIRNPEIRFFDLIKKEGYPNRFMRFCCSELKEYPIKPRVIMGIRREESMKRKKLYHEPEECRIYKNLKGRPKARAYYPILEWTLEDVAEFIAERGIKCAPVYYDEQGVFHPERRLGCMACPLASQSKRIETFKQYPKLLLRWVEVGKEYEKRSTSRSAEILEHNSWNFMFYSLYCKDMEDYQQKMAETLFGEKFCPEEFLRKEFNLPTK